MIYYLLIEKKTIHLNGESDFNNKIKWLLKHLGGSIGPYKIEQENLYLEWNDNSLEDINFFRKHNWWVWYGFIQSKSTQEAIYTNLGQIRHTIKRFYLNEHFQSNKICSFVIASNVLINAVHKKKILDNSISLKLELIEKEILEKNICNKLDLPSLILAIESNNETLIELILDKTWECSFSLFKEIYKKLSIILENIYIFDSISPKNIMDSFIAIKKKSKKEKIFFTTVYKATRKKIPDLSDDDYILYTKYPDTKFWGNIKTDIINGGFLLLDS